MAEHKSTASVHDSGPGSLLVGIATGGQTFPGDEPVDAGGTGRGPSPYDLLSAALATCTTMTVRLYADHKVWLLEHIAVSVEHTKETGATPPDVFHRTVTLTGPLDDEQRARLLQIAERCPVHRTLTTGARIETLAD
jgi:putative redox protein